MPRRTEPTIITGQINKRGLFKLGYRQAKGEIKMGMKPKLVFSKKLFWIGYNLAVMFIRKK